jgi:hypothetical protein
MPTRIALASLLLAAAGCTTSFYGSPLIKGGRPQCEQICAAWSMELAGMVQMGEYSNGCVCEVPGKMLSPRAAEAAGEAAAGVWAQMQEQRRRAAAGSAAVR